MRSYRLLKSSPWMPSDGRLESQASLDSAYAAAQAEKARYQSAIDQSEQNVASPVLASPTGASPAAGIVTMASQAS